MGGSLLESELQNIKNRGYPYSNIANFIETGTYKADSSLIASKYFKKVYTIEIFEPLFLESKNRAQTGNINNITFILGDTLEKLNEIIPMVLEGSVFFIDAHISGMDSSWNSKIRVPLMEELNTILSYTIGPSVFIFNDVRFWNGPDKAWDWSHISHDSIIRVFKEKGIKLSCFTEENDRLYVFTK